MDLIFFKPPNSKFYCTYNASQNKLTFSALAARELNLNQSSLIKLARSADNYNPDIYLFTVDKTFDCTFPIYTSGTVCYISKIDLDISNPGDTVFDMLFPPHIIDNFEMIPHLKFAVLSRRKLIMVIKTDVDQIRHGRLLSLKGKTALQLDEGKLWYSVDVPILLEYIDQLEKDLKTNQSKLPSVAKVMTTINANDTPENIITKTLLVCQLNK